ncbi:MAG TPA: DUF3280 domain-containing protein [Hyphomicrobiaceae bacterium]|jgi:hypothetical protein|nr:DUF3280 domain-containing protein [Hyphomicrobiaceae bacterium]
MIRLTFALVVVLLAGTSVALAGPRAAVFPFELSDGSLEGELSGPRPDETRRLALLTEELRQLAARAAGYEVVDLGGLTAEIEKAAPLYKCNGCEVELARRVGANVAITGYVRKVSNLILKVFIVVRDVETGKIARVHQADIKGNSDETWLRGVRYIVANGLVGGSGH